MIETERLVLTPPAIGDLEDSYSMASNPATVRFIGGKIATREDAWTKILRNIGHWEVFNYGIFTVREKASNAFVGEVGPARFGRDFGDAFDPYPEAARVIARRAWGMNMPLRR